ncbi:MAG: phosphotriesterase family protein [Tepidiformaceae bacterium]
MATIQSATGPIDTEDLGFTLMHEHIRVGWGPMFQQYPELFDRASEVARAVERLKAAKAAGVQTVVDLTPIDLGRDVTLIAEAAKQSGMQVIAPTGVYYAIPFHFAYREPAELTGLLVRDITQGVSSTGIRAGVIKCATEEEMHAHNERALRASAAAHRQTGVPICTHSHPAARTGLDQQRVFKEEGCDLGRIVIGHSDDAEDIGYLEELIDGGSFVGMDRMGLQQPRTSDQRADMVAKLVERGYADRLTLSHDSCCNFHWAPQSLLDELAPDWKMTHISEAIIPKLRERGVSDQAIDQMTVLNPRRIFEQNQPY